MSQVSDEPPSEGPLLHSAKNSGVSHGKVKAGLFREIQIPQAESGPSQKTRGGPRMRGG